MFKKLDQKSQSFEGIRQSGPSDVFERQCFSADQGVSSALRLLLEVEVPSARSIENSRTGSKAALKVWEEWEELSVTWPCQPNNGS